MKINLNSRWQLWLFYFAFAKAILLTTSCKTSPPQLQKVSGEKIAIDTTITGVNKVNEFIAPFKKSLDGQMNEALSYNPQRMHKNDYKLNTPIGNMMAHTVMTQGNPVFKKRTGNDIDIVLLNHGGIRAAMNAGPVTMRTAYEIMPFENEMVVATLNKSQMKDLVKYLTDRERAHPFQGIKIQLSPDGNHNISMPEKENYYVATSDYLYNSGDNMSFFKDTPVVNLDYKIRNAMIDFFKKTDTLRFENDDRFTYKN